MNKGAFDIISDGQSIKELGETLNMHNSLFAPTFMMDSCLDHRGGKINISGTSRFTQNIPEYVQNIIHTITNETAAEVAFREEAIKKLNIVPNPVAKNQTTIGSGMLFSRNPDAPQKGITALDFDDTLATTKSRVITISPDGTKGFMNAAQYAKGYTELAAQGYKFEFSEFSKVIKGKPAPLLNKALKLAKKFGTESMFIVTARPADSAPAIREFLLSQGLDIPLKNITGLANSTSEAKALWVADKIAEGYNDWYFADDALQNVQAVQNMLDQHDVKSKVQQARMQFSKNADITFNQMIEDTRGTRKNKKFSDAKAKQRGKDIGKWNIFLPAAAEDFKGLLYYFIGKG